MSSRHFEIRPAGRLVVTFVLRLAALGLVTSTALPGAVAPRYAGLPQVQMFTERDVPGNPQARMVAVHPNGLVYVANTEGLAEFDGVAWRLIAGSRGLTVHGLAVDSRGRVWYAGYGEFGYLAPNAEGAFELHSLVAKLPDEWRDVGHMLQLAIVGEDVYIASHFSRGFIVHVDSQETVHILQGEGPCLALFVHEGAVYSVTPHAAQRIAGDKLEPAPAAHVLARVGLRSVWPRAGGGAWVVSADGLRVWHEGEARLVSNAVATLLQTDRVACGCPLGDGTFALGTEQHGLLLIAEDGTVLARYDEATGLGATTSTITAATVDAEGGLWLAHNAGVSRVQVRTPAAIQDWVGGVHGRVNAFAFFQGRLQVAASQGLYERDPNSGRFRLQAGGGSDPWALLPTQEGLYVAAMDLRLLRPNGEVEIIDAERRLFRSVTLLHGPPDRLVASTGPGLLRVYRREASGWVVEGTVGAVRDALFPLLPDRAGRLWALRNRQQLVRIDWRKGVDLAAKVEVIGAERGLPDLMALRERAEIFLLDGQVEFSSPVGLWRYLAEEDRFVPETRIKGRDPGRWSLAFPLGDGSLWLANRDRTDVAAIARPRGPGAWQLEPLPYTGLESIRPRAVIEDHANSVAWLGYERLAAVELQWQGEQSPPPAARVRSVTTAAGETLWHGAGTARPLLLSAEQRSLRFTYAAPLFRPDAYGQIKTQYQTRLDGLETDWSAWTSVAQRDYANLPPGRFTFRVRARDGMGREASEGTWAFTLRPPWWRTWWFLTLAALVGIGSVIGLTRWYAQRRLKRRLAQLEEQSAVERERLRLARDLHDEVGSGLGRVILFAGQAKRSAGDPVQLNASLERIKAAAQELVHHARQIVWAVNPRHDTLASLAERLSEHAVETLRAANISCRLDVPAELPPIALRSEIRHSIFLAVKEALHNAVKYSRATEVRLGIRYEQHTLSVRITDNGDGFVLAERKGSGHGLDNIRFRAESFGGSAEIVSAPGRGTTIGLQVPIATATNRESDPA